jgi:L-threonylcarbamoyladenylate synthase
MARRYDCTDVVDRKHGLREAASAVRRGDLVVLPTDTVYGIGWWVTEEDARAFARGRPHRQGGPPDPP